MRRFVAGETPNRGFLLGSAESDAGTLYSSFKPPIMALFILSSSQSMPGCIFDFLVVEVPVSARGDARARSLCPSAWSQTQSDKSQAVPTASDRLRVANLLLGYGGTAARSRVQ